MSGRCARLAGAALLAAAMAGCTSLSPDARIEEASALVEQNTGQRPAWAVPWDEEDRVWDARALLGVHEAVVIALRNNRELRADLEMIGQANADLVQAGLLQNPVVNLMIMFPDGGGRAMLRGSGLPMQPLQDLWLIPARQRVARADLQQAVLRVADRAVETAAAVKKVYARLQYTQRAMELIRENIQIVTQSTDLIRARQAAGRTTQTAVNLSLIRGLRLRSELRAMEAEHRAAQRELLMLMGAAGAGDQWTVAPIREMEDPLDPPAGEDPLLTLAAEQRLDLRAARWQVESAEQSILLLRREGWPEVALGLGLERMPAAQSNNPKWLGQAGNTAVRGLVDRASGMPSGPMLMPPFNPKMRDPKYLIGPMLDVEIPIFDWNQARVARAIHEYRQRAAQYQARAQEVTRTVRETLVMLLQAFDQVRFYRDAILPAVEQNLDLARRSFIGGQEDLTIYLEAQEDRLMTRLKALEFLRDYRVNQADLERAVGGRLPLTAASSQPAPTTQAAGGK